MPVKSRVASRLSINSILVDNFSGGWNLRDAPSELSANETPDCLNITLDERGGVVKRLGFSKRDTSVSLPAKPSTMYYSNVAGALLAYISADGGAGKLYKSLDSGGSWTVVTSTFTSGAMADIVDFKSRVVLVNTADGVYSYPSNLGAPTHTAGGTNHMEEVRGSSIAIWHNRVWVTGDPREDSTHSKARVWVSAIADELTWTVGTEFVDIRDVDTLTTTAIGAGQGRDEIGRPSLLVYKQNSMYAINDPTTFAYTTLASSGAGAASNNVVAANLGKICSINDKGIWVTDGSSIPTRISDKISPLFTDDGINTTLMSQWTSGVYRDRIFFAITQTGVTADYDQVVSSSSMSIPIILSISGTSTTQVISVPNVNNLLLEYHPIIGWIVPHRIPVGPMVLVPNATEIDLVAASSVTTDIYSLFQGGSDLGSSISSYYQTPWFQPNGAHYSRFRRLRVAGRGQFKVGVLNDYRSGGGSTSDLNLSSGGSVWNQFRWNDPTSIWGPFGYESFEDIYSLGRARAVAFRLTETSSSSSSDRRLLNGRQPEVGSFAMYQMQLDYVPLGAS